MTVLDEMQFEIMPTADAVDGFKFGIHTDVSADDGGFSPGDDDWTIQDSNSETDGHVNFGRDHLNGPTWSWQLHVNRTDTAEAVATLEAFRTAWRALHIRETPGEYLAIRYRLGDRYRRIYGRPRRFSAPPNNLIMSGFIPVQTDFRAIDAFTYDDEAESTLISLAITEAEGGGFTFPITFPFEGLPPGEGNGSFIVGGSARTYPVVRFNGPVTNPTLIHQNWTLSVNTEIADNQWVEVDLRPWKRTAFRNNGADARGGIGRRQRLSSMKLEPGPHSLIFTGTSLAGGATAEVRWHSAHNSL